MPARKAENGGNKEPRQIDDKYDLSAFRHDMFSGSLRWLASILAALGLALTISLFTGIAEKEFYWPLPLRGSAALWAAACITVFWFLITVINWIHWLRP